MSHPSSIINLQKEAEATRTRGFRFFRWLKTLDRRRVDVLARDTHIAVFAAVDCLACTNCCKTLKPEFRERDLQNAAAHLALTTETLKTAYLEQNAQGNWQTNATPCPFLAPTGHCRIYAVRPGDCRDFPHTDKTSFASRSWTHTENLVTCPAVFAIIERMEARLGWREQGR